MTLIFYFYQTSKWIVSFRAQISFSFSSFHLLILIQPYTTMAILQSYARHNHSWSKRLARIPSFILVLMYFCQLRISLDVQIRWTRINDSEHWFSWGIRFVRTVLTPSESTLFFTHSTCHSPHINAHDHLPTVSLYTIWYFHSRLTCRPQVHFILLCPMRFIIVTPHYLNFSSTNHSFSSINCYTADLSMVYCDPKATFAAMVSPPRTSHSLQFILLAKLATSQYEPWWLPAHHYVVAKRLSRFTPLNWNVNELCTFNSCMVAIRASLMVRHSQWSFILQRNTTTSCVRHTSFSTHSLLLEAE